MRARRRPRVPVRPLARESRDDRGYASIEVLGMLPFFFLAAAFVLQLAFIGYGAMKAESSARYAAREVSRGEDPTTVRQQVQARARGLEDVTVAFDGGGTASADGEEPGISAVADGDAVSAVVSVTIPSFFHVDLLDVRITRHAVMPRTG